MGYFIATKLKQQTKKLNLLTPDSVSKRVLKNK